MVHRGFLEKMLQLLLQPMVHYCLHSPVFLGRDLEL
jgi:hypothetical protein